MLAVKAEIAGDVAARTAGPRYIGDLIPPARTTFAVRTHFVTVECLEKCRWRVSIDGRLLASFCSESRARVAGRTEARRLDFVASDLRQGLVPLIPKK